MVDDNFMIISVSHFGVDDNFMIIAVSHFGVDDNFMVTSEPQLRSKKFHDNFGTTFAVDDKFGTPSSADVNFMITSVSHVATAQHLMIISVSHLKPIIVSLR